MDALANILVPIVTFALGAFLDRLHVNQENDSNLRKDSLRRVDGLVEAFHQRFAEAEAERKIGITLFDYDLRSLIDDTSIRPVIGGRMFDGEYTRLIGEIYKLSVYEPSQIGQVERDALLKSVNGFAIDLKKIISSTRRHWRIVPRR